MRLFTRLLLIAFAYSSTPIVGRAEILFNGVSQGSQATIQAGDSVVGSGPTAGVVLGGHNDRLSVLGGIVAVDGVDSIGIRQLGGIVEMSGGSVQGVSAGVRVEGGVFNYTGGTIRDGVEILNADSLFTMSGGGISNRNVVVSAGAAFSISGGTIFNSRVQAAGEASRVYALGGFFSWLDAINGGEAHVYGTAFSINGTPVDFGGAVEFAVPPTAGYIEVIYADGSINSPKVVQSMGGTITLHRLITGDFNNDGDVDGRDFLVWQRNPSIGDLSDWQANYGAGSLIAAVAVPEPSAVLLALVGMTVIVYQRRYLRAQ